MKQSERRDNQSTRDSSTVANRSESIELTTRQLERRSASTFAAFVGLDDNKEDLLAVCSINWTKQQGASIRHLQNLMFRVGNPFYRTVYVT